MARRRRKSAPPISLFSFQDIITSVTGIMILITLMLGLELVQRTVNSPPRKTAEVTESLQAATDAAASEIEDIKDELRKRQPGVIEAAGLDPASLRRELQDVQELNQQLQQELSASEKQQAEAERRRKQAQSEKDRRAEDSRTLAELREQVAEAEARLQELKQSNRVIFNPASGSAKRPWLVEVSDRGLLVGEAGKAQKPQSFAGLAPFREWAARRNADAEYFVLLVKPAGVDTFYAVSQALQQLKFDVGYDLLTASQTALDSGAGAGAEAATGADGAKGK